MSKQKVSSRTIDSKNGIIGLAVGDAIGVPLEFLNREDLINNPVTTMLEDKRGRIPKGSWSDDTSLNIALIDSINKNQKIDLYDIGQRFIAWGENGEYTPTGKMFGTYFSKETIDKYKRILGENIAKCELEEIKSTGFVIDTLEATIWTLLNTDSYNQAIIGAINLGGDADTVGACVGGVAGIYYGLESINKDWIKDLQKYDYIENMCNEFNKVLNEEDIRILKK